MGAGDKYDKVSKNTNNVTQEILGTICNDSKLSHVVNY